MFMSQAIKASTETKATSVLGWAALCLGSVWIGSLLLMVIATSNPVTVNRVQLDESLAVVSARVISIDPSEVEVLEVLVGQLDEKKIVIRNLPKTPAQAGQTYFLPIIPAIQRDGLIEHVFEVTPSPLPDPIARTPRGLPIIYPATDVARAQLQELSGRK